MTNEIKRLIRISTLRDVQIGLKESQIDGCIVPESVYEVIKDLECKYMEAFEPEGINLAAEQHND